MKLFITLIMSMVLLSYASMSSAQTIMGWLENITISLNNQPKLVQAKIDSGADNSSLHAQNVVIFDKNGSLWVRFDTFDDINVILPLKRYAKIKTKKLGHQRRPVVSIEVCLAGVLRHIEVNLVNRKHFSKPLLIGRSALSGFLIDPTKKYILQSDTCSF